MHEHIEILMEMLTSRRRIFNTTTKNARNVSNNKTRYILVPENKSSISFQGKVFVVWDHAPSIMVKIEFISAQLPVARQMLSSLINITNYRIRIKGLLNIVRADELTLSAWIAFLTASLFNHAVATSSLFR